LWARAFVISAGVIMNFLFAFASYTVVAGVWGFQDFATTRVADVRADILPAGTEALADIPPGARLVRVGPRDVAHWHDIQEAFLDLPAGPTRVALAEPTTTLDVRLPADDEARRLALGALRPWIEPEIGAVNPGSPADRGGVRAGDRIFEVDGEPVRNSDEFVRAIRARPEQRTELTIEREGSRLVRVVTPEVASREEDPETGEELAIGAIGVAMTYGETVSIPASPADAVRYGWRQTVGITGEILGFLGDLFTGDVSPRSMGSIVTIGQASGQAAEAGLAMFLQFMALFSVNLAILNLLPIPVLDGGHLLFLTIEAVRGRALSVEQRLRWSNVGFLIVMGIMLWALGNDFLRLLGL
jgi:regulator of sigma E protease